jgi:hypothetical protein
MKPAPVAALDYEIVQEQASALGRLGRALETALAALSDYDSAGAAPAVPDAARAELVAAASEALWYFMVQRETCGLRDQQPIIHAYRVPAEVHARMGVFQRR